MNIQPSLSSQFFILTPNLSWSLQHVKCAPFPPRRYMFSFLMQIPARRIRCCGGNRQIHTDHRVLWRKREGMATLSRREHHNPWPLTGFYCFSGHITSRMVLIYSAQVHHRWLPFKEDKGQNPANYFKEKDVIAQGGNCSHSILGWFNTDFRKMKILSKHLLPQFRVREF